MTSLVSSSSDPASDTINGTAGSSSSSLVTSGKFKSSTPPSSSSAQQPNEETAAAAAAAVKLAHLMGRLKTTPRTGWVRRGVPRYESVADHSWRVAALSILLLAPPPTNRSEKRGDHLENDDHNDDAKDGDKTIHSLDAVRCFQMGVVHDLAECLVGDIAPDDNISKQDKQRMEAQAVEKIASLLRKATTTTNTTLETTSTPTPATTTPEAAATKTTTTFAEQYLLELFHEYEQRQSPEAKAVKDFDLLDMILQADEYERRFGGGGGGIDLSDFFESTPLEKFQTAQIREMARVVHEQRNERLLQQQRQEQGKHHQALENEHCTTKNGLSFSITDTEDRKNNNRNKRKLDQSNQGPSDQLGEQQQQSISGKKQKHQRLCPKDGAFVEEFSKAYSGKMDPSSIAEVVRALRAWDDRCDTVTVATAAVTTQSSLQK